MGQIPFEELRDLLDEKYLLFNTPAFIDEDPVSIPHLFTQKEDIEISGFLTALIAWGRRASIISNAQKLVSLMDMAPYDFVMNATDDDLSSLQGFVHRTFNAEDCTALMRGLRHIYRHHGGLEGVFANGLDKQSEDVYGAIIHARAAISAVEEFPARTHKHLANPAKGSSAKRINMYLRWMVRKDHGGVDFGLWKRISMRQLICPLDVHTGNVARKLGLLTRKQNDWKAAAELTGNLRKFDPDDPVKYDFSLFGLGVYEGF